MRTESTTLARQREIKFHGDTECIHRPWIIFHISNHACLLVSPSQLCVWCETSFRSPPQNGTNDFQLSSSPHVWFPTDCFYRIVPDYQINLTCFLSCTHNQLGSHIWVQYFYLKCIRIQYHCVENKEKILSNNNTKTVNTNIQWMRFSVSFIYSIFRYIYTYTT